MTGFKVTYVLGRVENVEADEVGFDEGWLRFRKNGKLVYHVVEAAVISVEHIVDGEGVMTTVQC